ncbi:hypothetical protein ONQ87_25065, partial [Salmonella enterica subsp. enterica serovar Virginia]|nr:hypothetical protein [Salmonella enterica subsp. enterica serovar Virginia]
QMLIIISQRLMVGAFSHEDMVWLRTHFNAPNLNESDISDVLADQTGCLCPIPD